MAVSFDYLMTAAQFKRVLVSYNSCTSEYMAPDDRNLAITNDVA